MILTAYASVSSAIDAVNKGAFQYIEKKAKNDEIALVVKNALSMGRLQSENQVLKRQLRQSHSERKIIGKSEEMMKVFKMIEKVADTEATMLVHGETGTGKELIAREIHYLRGGPRDRSCRSTAARFQRISLSRISSGTFGAPSRGR